MNKKQLNILSRVGLATVLFFALTGLSCSKSTSDSGEADLNTIFIADGGNTGSITLTLNDDRLNVADTAGFKVQVDDANGNGVANIPVICDTENDLSLIEPSSGTFTTDSSGEASGVFGCADRGSFLIACRVATGGNVRAVQTVVCLGDKPIGFDGFAGAGGGTLGNGVADIGEEDPDAPFAVRVTSLSFSSAGADNTKFIDTLRDADCGSGDPEPFGDDLVTFTILNDSNDIASFTSYSYSVTPVGGGSTFTSPSISLIGQALEDGQSGTFTAFFTDAIFDGTDTVKTYIGASSRIPSGQKNVTFTINGVLSSGTAFTVQTTEALSFDDFENC